MDAETMRLETAPDLAALTSAEVARELHAAGLNVFPLPPGKKHGTVWKFMQYSRLRAEDIKLVFAGYCNIAVIVGRLSDNLFVLDYETELGFTSAMSELSARGIAPWAVRTVRGGHIYLRSADGPIKSIATGKVLDMEVRGQGGYVIAPPSIHPSGQRYTWFLRRGEAPPLVRASDIDFLRDLDGLPVALEPNGGNRSRTAPYLTRLTLEYLARGHALPQGQRHDAFLNACRNYRDVGYERADMERDLVPIARASGLPDPADPGELSRLIESAMSTVTPKTRKPRADALPDPDSVAWNGRTARTDRAVFAAVVERARLGSGAQGIFRASQRELLTLASIADYHTLGKALARLVERDLLERAGSDKISGAALWRWGKAAQELARASRDAAPSQNAPKADVNHSTGSLIREDSSAVIYVRFSPHEKRVLDTVRSAGVPLKLKQLIKQSGLTEGQVKHTLRAAGALRQTGTVTHIKGGWTLGAQDAEALQALAAKAERKRQAIRQRTEAERAKDAAHRLIAWRWKNDRDNFREWYKSAL